MAVWYYLEKGRPNGPVNTEHILGEIGAGRLHRQDLIYREHDTQWREVQSFAEFQKHLDEKKDVKKTGAQVNGQWVLLARKSGGGGYRQKGPYSTDDIIRFLKDGKVKITDYVWREGLKEWYKILAVPEIKEQLFDPDQQTQVHVMPPVPVPSSIASLPDLPDDDFTVTKAASIAANSVTATNSAPLAKEQHVKGPATKTATPQQPKVEKPELANELKEILPKPGSNKKIQPGRAEKTALKIEGQRVGPWAYFIELSPVKRTVFATGLFLSVVITIVIIFWLSSYLDRRNSLLHRPQIAQVPATPSQTITESKTAEQSPRPIPAPAPVLAKVTKYQPARPPIVVKHPPTYIQVTKSNDGRDNPILQIRSDASADYFFKVELSADAGNVVEYPSFYTRRTITGMAARSIQLANWRLPLGRYHYSVESNNVKATGRINIGTFDKEWLTEIKKQRKDLIFRHNDERVAFIRAADHLATVDSKLAAAANQNFTVSGWLSFYRGWKKEFMRIRDPILSRISPNNRRQFLHPTQWLDLRDLKKKMDKSAKDLNRVKLKRQTSRALAQQIRDEARMADTYKNRMIYTSIMR